MSRSDFYYEACAAYQQRIEELELLLKGAVNLGGEITARHDRYRAALVIAQDAMNERRGYANAWEWKYGKAWDEEDAQIRAALEGGGE